MGSKFLAERGYRMTNENDDLVVCFVVHGENKRAAMLAMEEMKSQEKRLDVEVKPYKSKRSLEQNRLLWALLGKMADGMSGNKRRVSTDECYCLMLEEANVSYDFLIASPETEPMLKDSFRVVRKVGQREINGREMNEYQCFVGSSKFNTKEMTDLIEATLDRLAEMGIFDSEIEIARQEYRR